MSTMWSFTVALQSEGDTAEQAWNNLVDRLGMDPGDPLEAEVVYPTKEEVTQCQA